MWFKKKICNILAVFRIIGVAVLTSRCSLNHFVFLLRKKNIACGCSKLKLGVSQADLQDED